MKGSNSKKTKPMSKRELVKEISDVTGLKTVVVMSVINAFIDIFIRETVIKGCFNLSNCFTVKTHDVKARTQYNVNKDKYQDYPKTKRLGISLSSKIHGFYRWKQRHEYNEKHGLTIEDWQNRDGSDIPK